MTEAAKLDQDRALAPWIIAAASATTTLECVVRNAAALVRDTLYGLDGEPVLARDVNVSLDRLGYQAYRKALTGDNQGAAAGVLGRVEGLRERCDG